MTWPIKALGWPALFALAAIFVALTSGRTAHAQALTYDLRVDLPVTFGGLSAVVVSEAVKNHYAPLSCRWCDRSAGGEDSLNAVDRTFRGLRWHRTHLADIISDGTGFLLTPAAVVSLDAVAAGHDERSRGIAADLLVVTETGVLSADLCQLVKFLALRQRPYAHAPWDDPEHPRVVTAEDNVSFYSGHTSETVSLAVAAGTVATLRGYRLAPFVWLSLVPAVATGYLRMAADRHYFTDVMTGAVAGALVGVLVPYLFHAPPAAATSTATVPSNNQGYVLGYSGYW